MRSRATSAGITACVATCCALLGVVVPLHAQSTAAGSTVIRSDDGFATLSVAGSIADAKRIRIVKRADSDPAAVVGTHYSIESSAPIPLPATLSIQWPVNGLPGGVTDDALTIAKLDHGAWKATATTAQSIQILATQATGVGEFVVRWNARKRCAAPTARALYFRIGTWSYSAPGYDPGTSVMTADSSGCALFDDFVDVSGGRSKSFFVYNPLGNQWFVTTYDPSGRSIMEGTVDAKGAVFYHSTTDRETYRTQPDGTVAFAAERSADGGAEWKTWATATYARKP